MKIRVKFLTSIAGLGDPDREKLDAKYAHMREALAERKRSDDFIQREIAEAKRLDRYDAPLTGFARDWSYKPGDELMIEEKLARSWEEAGICIIVDVKSRAA